MKFEPKNDRYRRARGGLTRLYNLYCSACRHHVLLYQKDGPPGHLVRLYANRILAPESLTEVHSVDAIRCEYCQTLIGVPFVYEKEQRPAFLLEQGSVIKKRSQGTYPPRVPIVN